MTEYKWHFPLNKWGQPAPKDLLLLMIAEQWEKGNFNTAHLEKKQKLHELVYFTPKVTRVPGGKR